MDRGAKISIGVTIFFIGIPTAADFYPPLFAGLAESLPLNQIFTWMHRVGILALGILIGWLSRGARESEPQKEAIPDEENQSTEENDEESVDTIVGCVAVDDAVWRGVAEFADTKVENVEVSKSPRCPKCQMEMTRESYKISNRGVPSPIRSRNTATRRLWQCPNEDCGHSSTRETDQSSTAERLFRGFTQEIVESEGQEVSLDNLLERADGEITPQSVWIEYSKIKDNDHVSTNCFC